MTPSSWRLSALGSALSADVLLHMLHSFTALVRYVVSRSADDSKELARVGPGHCLGELALMSGDLCLTAELSLLLYVLLADDSKELARVGPGQCFGELALMSGDLRAANVMALDSSVVRTACAGIS
jgi:CRP-like cAMP-binding protein